MGPDPSDARHRMPREILHPMPRKSEKSGFSDFRKSGFSEIRKSGNLKIRIFGFPDIRTFGNRISEIPDYPKIRIFRHSDFPDFRNQTKSVSVTAQSESGPARCRVLSRSGPSGAIWPSGIGCPGKFYIRCPGHRKIWIFRFPEIRMLSLIHI